MNLTDKIAERRIQDAMERGQFEALPGAGKPLDLTDDAGVPEELRLAYRVLRNAGFVPPQISLRHEIAKLQATVLATEDSSHLRRSAQRLALLMAELERSGSRHLLAQDAYYQKIVRVFTHSHDIEDTPGKSDSDQKSDG